VNADELDELRTRAAELEQLRETAGDEDSARRAADELHALLNEDPDDEREVRP